MIQPVHPAASCDHLKTVQATSKHSMLVGAISHPIFSVYNIEKLGRAWTCGYIHIIDQK